MRHGRGNEKAYNRVWQLTLEENSRLAIRAAEVYNRLMLVAKKSGKGRFSLKPPERGCAYASYHLDNNPDDCDNGSYTPRNKRNSRLNPNSSG